MKHSIRTRYRGILFRSKLEADWARAFDALGVRWEYEKEGRYWGDIFYLPDFYLPASRQWVEVKGGGFAPEEFSKALALVQHSPQRAFTDSKPVMTEDGPRYLVGCAPDLSLIGALPDGQFFGFHRPWFEGGGEVLYSEGIPVHLCIESIGLYRCRACGDWWFLDTWGSYVCQCCGVSDGDHHVAAYGESPISTWLSGAVGVAHE